jgi:hypothetical protein
VAVTPILDSVNAILADGSLSSDEKSRQIKIAKATGLHDALLAFAALPHVWSFSKSGITYTVTLSGASVVGIDLVLILAVTKAGVVLRINNPIVLRNAPCQVLAAATKTYDPVTAVRAVLADAVIGL